MKMLVFRNAVQVALFTELDGQLSDGMWENTRPYDHYKPWCEAETTTTDQYALKNDGSKVLGRNFWAPKDNYNFNSSFLLECVGDRMLKLCRDVAGQNFTMAMMRTELKDMMKIVRMSW